MRHFIGMALVVLLLAMFSFVKVNAAEEPTFKVLFDDGGAEITCIDTGDHCRISSIKVMGQANDNYSIRSDAVVDELNDLGNADSMQYDSLAINQKDWSIDRYVCTKKPSKGKLRVEKWDYQLDCILDESFEHPPHFWIPEGNSVVVGDGAVTEIVINGKHKFTRKGNERYMD